MNDNYKAGFSILESLIAILLFSIVALGFINFQTAITSTMQQARNKHIAHTIAFEILERYPDITKINLPAYWNYKIITSNYAQCKIVTVFVQINNIDEQINQQRWYCRL